MNNFSIDFKFQMMFVLIFFIFIYFNYKMNNIQNLITENFADTSITDQKLYQTDITAIRVLASIAASLNNGGLITPGNLTVGTPTTNQTFTVNGNEVVTGNSTISGNSTIKGNINANDSTITGNSTISGNSTIKGDSTITGNSTISGTTNINNHMYSNKNFYGLWFNGDSNNFIGHTYGNRSFLPSLTNGPAVVGWGGGILGTTKNGDRSALSWDADGNVTIKNRLFIGKFMIYDDGDKLQFRKADESGHKLSWNVGNGHLDREGDRCIAGC